MSYGDITLRAARRAALVLTALLPVAAVAADLASQAAALTADVPHGMVLYMKHCAGCHGRRAWGNGPREIPAPAGQREAYLIAQLAHFIDGARPGSEVHGPAMHDSLQPPDVDRAQALRDLGAWLSHAMPNREPEHGEGQVLSAASGRTPMPVRVVTARMAKGASSRMCRPSPASTTATCWRNCAASPRAI
jgi:cytochrome c553